MIARFNQLLIVFLCWILIINTISTQITAFLSFHHKYYNSNNNNIIHNHNGISTIFTSTSTSTLLLLSTSSNNRRMGELTLQEDIVYQFLTNVSKSLYAFRVVVVGKEDGSTILESTMNPFGSIIKVTQSPSKGTNLMTIASNDQLYEFHVNLSKVTKIILIEKETPSKTLRIIRLINHQIDNDNNETTLASLILATSTNDAYEWFTNDIIGKYGKEIITTNTNNNNLNIE